VLSLRLKRDNSAGRKAFNENIVNTRKRRKTMGKYLLIWRLDPARVPTDPKERGAGWSGLMGMVKKDIEKGVSKDWGAFIGEGGGYAIAEGSELEVSLMTQQYTPYVHFETHPIMSVSQVDDMIKALGD
jgi:hypothetical protein